VKDDRTYLQHIQDALAQLRLYADEGREHFLADRRTQEAVVLNFQVLGQAVKNLSDDIRNRHADVPWKLVAGMRDKLVHEYFGINHELLWDVLEREIPALATRIDQILDESD
jgi:uncharacterized protein with HEPN domain